MGGLETMTVLVVDDAAFMRVVLKGMLERAGCTVIGEAVNGLDAYNKYMELKPDLVTMGITMPEVDGLQGVELIRKYDDKAKIIMCSAMGQRDFVIEAIKKGALDFIIKPFDEGRVREAIKKISDR